jgi:hypothetical protein
MRRASRSIIAAIAKGWLSKSQCHDLSRPRKSHHQNGCFVGVIARLKH